MSLHTTTILIRREGFINRSLGFTLVEIMVVLAIITSLLSVIFWDYRSGINTEAVNASAREIRAALREAQLWANSSRPFPADAPETDKDRFDRGFGIIMQISDPNKVTYYGGKDATSTEYISSNFVRQNSLPNRSQIKSMCVSNSPSGSPCDSRSSLRIFFRRPSLNPRIDFNDILGTGAEYARIVITPRGPLGEERWLEIYRSGRVEVVKP